MVRFFGTSWIANVSSLRWQTIAAARGSECLSDPSSDRQALRVSRLLYLFIFGILKDDL
jgi:hypothetical protein